jgi:ankyrin repeat protein
MDYAALSYTWGDEEKPYEIIVNGSRLAVTKNLHLALRHLRCQDQDRILWIDAICINQNNHRERGHQVQQMASIYNEAERVIIWIGLPTYDTDLIMNFMKKLEEESLRHTCNNWKTSDQGWANIWSVIQTGSSSSLMYRQREGLKSLLARSWFKRVWILQEVANARAAEIVCGTKSVSARIFALTPFLAGIVPDPHCQAVLDIMPGPSRKNSWWTQKRDLQTLLAKFGGSEASDPRDVIYALLGMSSDVSSSDSLKANYEKSVQEAIQDTTFFLLRFPESGYPTHGCPAWTLQEFLENLNSLGNAVLGWAVNMRYEAVVKLLVGRGDVNINMKDKSDWTPLSRAVERGYEAIVPLLIDSGAAVNIKNSKGEAALHKAALGGQEAVVRLLIDGGAAVNIRNQEEETALYTAALGGHEAVVRLLIDGGADVNIENQEGETALYTAALGEHEAVVRMLVGRGAAVDTKNFNGETVLLQAASKESDGMVRVLVDLGADINAKDTLRETALRRVAVRESETMVRLLVGLGADINARGRHRETTLHQAVVRESETMVRLLVGLGADINAKGRRGDTALYRAAFNGNDVIAQLLVDHGVDINAKDEYGDTALHRAVFNGRQRVAQLLVDNGAEVNTRNNEGRTALSFAASGGFEAIVQLLISAGAF